MLYNYQDFEMKTHVSVRLLRSEAEKYPNMSSELFVPVYNFSANQYSVYKVN